MSRVRVGYAAHSTGVFLVAMLLPIVLVERVRRELPWAGPCVVAVVTAAVGMWFAGRMGVWLEHTTMEGGNLAVFLEYAKSAVEHPERLPSTVWQEYAFPLMPIAVLWLWWFRGDGWRATAVAVGVASYVGFAFLILSGFSMPGGMDERGAYLLPLAWSLADAVVRAWGMRVAIAAVLVSGACGIWQLWQHDVRPQRDAAIGLRAEASETRPFLLLASPSDFEMLFLEFPEFVHLGDYLDMFRAAYNEDLAGGRFVAERVPDLIRPQLSSGRPVMISVTGIATLRAPLKAEHPELGPYFVTQLEKAFRFEPSDVDGWLSLTTR